VTSLRSYLHVTDLTIDELRQVLDLAARPIDALGRPLAGLGAALIFEKPSNRTRHSTEMAVVQLGGHPVYTRGDEIGFDVREPVEDVARILSGYHGVLTARVFDHSTLERLRVAATVPVVNLLSDQSHPLQAIADVLAMRAELGDLTGRTIAWVGDTNNVAQSLTQACVMLGAHMRIASPAGFGPSARALDEWRRCGPGTVTVTHDPAEAVEGAHAVHTDTWVSMGQEAEKQQRVEAFAGFCVDDQMMSLAAPHATFYHCLPAYRGYEVAASVIDGPNSRVIPQGHRRLDAARAVLAFVMGVRP
jgi:ornithine carbamoyltransferase